MVTRGAIFGLFLARSRQHHCLTCPSAVTAGFLTTPFLSGVTSTAIFANIGDEVMAHSGFLSAYLSVRTAILALLKTLTSSRGDGPWTFYVTGHSLGGALPPSLRTSARNLSG